MVIVKVSALERAMKKAGLHKDLLAYNMGCSHRTIERILAGDPIGNETQRALHKALGDHSPGAKLFEIDLGDGV
jgi:hypothetical protein